MQKERKRGGGEGGRNRGRKDGRGEKKYFLWSIFVKADLQV